MPRGKILESCQSIDVKLAYQMIYDGAFSFSELISIRDILNVLWVRGAFFLEDFARTCNLLALDVALDLGIVNIYHSKVQAEMDFITLGTNGLGLYGRFFGQNSDRTLQFIPADIEHSYALVLGMNRYSLKNNLLVKKLYKTGPLIAVNRNLQTGAYAYKHCINVIRNSKLYSGKITPIEEPIPDLPLDMRAITTELRK